MNRFLDRMKEIRNAEASPGIVLMIAAAAALIASNSEFISSYYSFIQAPVAVRIGELEIAKSALLWINDGLMAVFFFLVGLEIKRELVEGELSSVDKAALPAIAALGGMIGPALIYVAVNWGGDPAAMNGWAIPAATDIAFALGVLALMGKRAPVALKTFLLALAIIDDLGAIIIIALFYTADLSTNMLMFAGIGFLIALALNRIGIRSLAPYVIIGVIMWVCVLKSGVHATLAGVLIALCVPLKARDGSSPLLRAEHALAPWVSFFVLPLFAFGNAGVALAGLSIEQLLAPVPLGIALGLILGKQIGVFGASFLAVRLGVASLPKGVNWPQIYALSCLAGIGFTMSLFIGSLAFNSAEAMDQVKLGVLAGSIVSGVVGYVVLQVACRRAAAREEAGANPA